MFLYMKKISKIKWEEINLSVRIMYVLVGILCIFFQIYITVKIIFPLLP